MTPEPRYRCDRCGVEYAVQEGGIVADTACGKIYPVPFDWRPKWWAFIRSVLHHEQVGDLSGEAVLEARRRMIAGEPEYGDRSWTEAPEHLRRQIREELLDVVNWSAILAHRCPTVADDLAALAADALALCERLGKLELP